MRLSSIIALLIGLVVAAGAVLYAGADAVRHALERLNLGDLLLLVLLHLPVAGLMGLAWWLVAGEDPPLPLRRFLWARFVRDAAQEVLPVLQFGGVLFGLRSLGGRAALTLGIASASIDGVIELGAKLPYSLAALLILVSLGAHSDVARWLSIAVAMTGLLLLFLSLARRSFAAWLAAIARAFARRWPSMASLSDGTGNQLGACFDRLLKCRAHLGFAFALHLCCWFLGAAEAWVIFRLLHVELTLTQALAIDGAVAALRTFAFMLPAAAGVQEASYVIAGALFGVTPAAAIAASFARRSRDLLLGVVILPIAAVRDFEIGGAHGAGAVEDPLEAE